MSEKFELRRGGGGWDGVHAIEILLSFVQQQKK